MATLASEERAKQALHAADVVWRSETDGALDQARLRALQIKYVAAAIEDAITDELLML